MKYIIALVILIIPITFSFVKPSKKSVVENVPKKIKITAKKQKFYKLLVPAVEKVHKELMQTYEKANDDIVNQRDLSEFSELKRLYKVKSDEELLYALKPHPKSITIAQAAMESGWGTSRFFVEANNIFGMWSSDINESRIAAGEQRDENQTIWLRKFDSIEDSVRAYYSLMGRAKAYKEFRKARFITNDVYEIVKKLDKYSERGEVYTEELSEVIRYNRLTEYDR